MIKQSIVDVVEGLRPNTIDSITSIQQGKVPSYIDLHARYSRNKYYIYNGKYEFPTINNTLLEVSGLRFTSKFSGTDVKASMIEMVNKNEIHPFLFFANGLFIEWSAITIIKSEDKEYLLINKRVQGDFETIHIPFKVFYSENGAVNGRTLFSFRNGLYNLSGNIKISVNNRNLTLLMPSSFGPTIQYYYGLSGDYLLTPDCVIIFRNGRPYREATVNIYPMNILYVNAGTGPVNCIITYDTRAAKPKNNINEFSNKNRLIELVRRYAAGQTVPPFMNNLVQAFNFNYSKTRKYSENVENALLYIMLYNSRLMDKVYKDKSKISSIRYTGRELRNLPSNINNILTLLRGRTGVHDDYMMMFVNGKLYSHYDQITYETNKVKIPLIDINDTDEVELLFFKNCYNKISELKVMTSNNITWATSGDLNNSREKLATCGNVFSALAFGGSNGEYEPQTTEIYNGDSWLEGADLNISRSGLAGCGKAGAALAFGGNTDHGNTEIYNGLVWRIGERMNSPKDGLTGCGNIFNAISIAGTTSEVYISTVETYNGDNWSAGPAANTARGWLASCGNPSNALAFGGINDSGILSITEKFYNNTWSAADSMNTPRLGLAASGDAANALAFGGRNNDQDLKTAEKYNGTTWNNTANMNTARKYLAGCGGVFTLATGGNRFITVVGVTETLKSSEDDFKTYIHPDVDLSNLKIYSNGSVDLVYPYPSTQNPNLKYSVEYSLAINNDVPSIRFNDEFYYNKTLYAVSDSQFRYMRYIGTEEGGIDIPLSDDFTLCHNKNRYMVFINGIKLSTGDYSVLYPERDNPIDITSIYSRIVINKDDVVDVFYLPIEYTDIVAQPSQEISGDIVIDKSKISYNFDKELYLIFANGIKISNDKIENKMNNKVYVIKNQNILNNLSIIKYIEEEEDLKDYFETESLLDTIIGSMTSSEFKQLTDIITTNIPYDENAELLEDLRTNKVTVITSSATLNAKRAAGVGLGEMNNAMCIGGYGYYDSSPIKNFVETEIFANDVWVSGPSTNTTRSYFAGAGIANSSIIFGGYASPTTEIYNGQSWLFGNNMVYIKGEIAGSGSRYAALSSGGILSGNSGTVETEEYNSSVWSAGSNMNIERCSHVMTGTQYDSLVMGGNYNNIIEKFDGTTWSVVNATLVDNRKSAAGGTQISGNAIIAGGVLPGYGTRSSIEIFENGSSYIAGNLNKESFYIMGCGSTEEAVFFGGHNGSPINRTELFTREINVVEKKAIVYKIIRDFWLAGGNNAFTGDVFIYNYDHPDEIDELDSDGNLILDAMNSNDTNNIV